MKTLIIYDNTGKIWVMMSGDYVVPNGLPYLEVEIGSGKRAVSVDVSVSPNVPVFENLPVPETEILKERITLLEGVVNSMAGL